MILVDTSAFHALLDMDDRHHHSAEAMFSTLRAADEPLLTHQYILLESTALIQRRLGLWALRRFVDDLLPIAQIAWVDDSLHLEALEALVAAGKRNVSLVDWTSFIVMRRRGVQRAFTFDPAYAAEGFDVLPAA